MIHRLFVCIAGVADQLQTNFAADLRRILRIVFSIHVQNDDMQNNESEMTLDPIETEISTALNVSIGRTDIFADEPNNERLPNHLFNVNTPQNSVNQSDIQEGCLASSENNIENLQQQSTNNVVQAPKWIPDNDAPLCMNCAEPFHAFFRRRHHCRNCGGVFCNVCSSLCTPLPKYGLYKAVRVCKDCFISESKNSE